MIGNQKQEQNTHVLHCQWFEEHYFESPFRLWSRPLGHSAGILLREDRNIATLSFKGKVMIHRQRQSLLCTSIYEEDLSLDQIGQRQGPKHSRIENTSCPQHPDGV